MSFKLSWCCVTHRYVLYPWVQYGSKLEDEQDEEYVPPDVATLDLTGGAATVDDAVAAAAAARGDAAAGGAAEVIITAPASLEESIVAVLDPDQGQIQQVALTRSDIFPVLKAAVRMDQVVI